MMLPCARQARCNLLRKCGTAPVITLLTAGVTAITIVLLLLSRSTVGVEKADLLLVHSRIREKIPIALNVWSTAELQEV